MCLQGVVNQVLRSVRYRQVGRSVCEYMLSVIAASYTLWHDWPRGSTSERRSCGTGPAALHQVVLQQAGAQQEALRLPYAVFACTTSRQTQQVAR